MYPKVSIIVPVYNTEKYIYDCLTSIVEQNFKNFEVIIVDDGSTDESGLICEDFIKSVNDNRFRLFHKGNGGLSEARNYGLNHCSKTSDFVVFLDSDDEITPNCLETLLEVATSDNLVTSPLTRCHKYNRPILKSIGGGHIYSTPWNNITFLNSLSTGIINTCCGKCYSLEIIRRYNLRFERTLPEDTLFNIAYIDRIKNIYVLNSSFYYYYIWEQSMSTHPDEKIFTNYIRIQDMLYDRVPSQYQSMVDKFVYPQYRVNAMNYISSNEYSLIDKYFSHNNIKRAFKVYKPVCIGDYIVHFLLSHKLYKFLNLYSRYNG